MADSPSTEIDVLVKAGTDLLTTNTSVSLVDLLKALSPAQVSASPPAKVPAPRKITDKQREAIERMPKVYGQVVPTERRALTEQEISTLLNERTTLDEVKKAAEARLKDITLIAHNHLDVEVDALPKKERSGFLLDKDGHYIVAGRFSTEDTDVEFSRETRENAPSLPLSALESLEQAGQIDHKTFLAMTSQVRVVDEAKVMAAIKKDPTLLAKVASVTIPGTKGTSMYVRTKQ